MAWSATSSSSRTPQPPVTVACKAAASPNCSSTSSCRRPRPPRPNSAASVRAPCRGPDHAAVRFGSLSLRGGGGGGGGGGGAGPPRPCAPGSFCGGLFVGAVHARDRGHGPLLRGCLRTLRYNESAPRGAPSTPCEAL